MTSASIDGDRYLFDTLARHAVQAGLVTREEVRIIARPGTRKHGYFGRHLADLRWLVARRAHGAR